MANQALIDYIMHQRVHGASPANIKNALLHAGWEEGDIEKGLKATAIPLDAPPRPPEVVIKPDQSSGAVVEATHTSPPAKKPPLLAIALLIISILVVAAAAIFIYVQFLRPQQVHSLDTPQKATTTKSVPVQNIVPLPLDGEAPLPPNSEGGRVQQDATVPDTQAVPQ
ncbi:MAG TPA: hypothetical protein VJ579_03185 [Candidatus Paceibacterota bacterium]|nr:hypothetical protein [Candidatus Paceibacterota bacterium]